jgi:hypothetical protein
MVELHSNFTANGSKTVEDGVLPSNHPQHKTLEVTQAFNSWFETGFYVFTSIQPDGGWQRVGDPSGRGSGSLSPGTGRLGSACRRFSWRHDHAKVDSSTAHN